MAPIRLGVIRQAILVNLLDPKLSIFAFLQQFIGHNVEHPHCSCCNSQSFSWQ